jgi:selenocysteine lyase/cysteine desulfurase
MDYRKEFFDFEDVAYLNCAAQGPLPRCTAEAIERMMAIKTRPDRMRDDIYFRLPEEARTELAALFGGRPHDYAITNGASDGVFAVARGLAWERGDEVLVGEDDFPSNFFPWAQLAERGVSLRVLSAEGGPVRAAQFLNALGRRTRVAAVSMVSYNTGYRLDIERLGHACRENGTILLADLSQAAGAVSLRLGAEAAALPIDVAVCAGYKWLLSPYGTGFAWFHPEVLGRLAVTDVYWQAVEGAANFNKLPRTGWKLAPGARRFDSTETASFLNLAAMIASLQFLRQVGVKTIERHAMGLLDRLIEHLPAGCRVASALEPRERSTIMAVEAPDAAATARLHRALLAARVIVSLREDRLRISPNIYNTGSDIARCLEALGGKH